jgi:hypothetical protein
MKLFGNGAKVIVAIDVVPPPAWERVSRTTSTEDSKGKDEKNSETCAIKGTSHQVRVIPKNARTVVSEVELNEEAREQLAQNDTCLALVVRDVTSVLDELGEVDVGNIEILDLRVKL